MLVVPVTVFLVETAMPEAGVVGVPQGSVLASTAIAVTAAVAPSTLPVTLLLLVLAVVVASTTTQAVKALMASFVLKSFKEA